MKKIQMLIVDDHQLVLDGLKYLLADAYDLNEITFINSVELALKSINDSPELKLLVTDLYLPTLSGFDLLETMAKRGQTIPTIILSSCEDASEIKRAIELGASGFISKSAASDEMVEAVEKVLSGEMYFCAEALDALQVSAPVNGETIDDATGKPTEQQSLSARQIDALKLIEQGFTNKQIASIMGLSESTIKFHIKALFRKLDADTRTGCVRSAREHGYL